MYEDDDSIDFKPVDQEKDMHDKIDTELLKIRDRIKIMDDVKTKPPIPGEMTQTIPEGVYAVDLDTLLSAQINDCPATVIPMLIDHGVRTAVDIKQTYKPKKRVLDFQYWWVIFLIIGLMGVLLIGSMFLGII